MHEVELREKFDFLKSQLNAEKSKWQQLKLQFKSARAKIDAGRYGSSRERTVAHATLTLQFNSLFSDCQKESERIACELRPLEALMRELPKEVRQPRANFEDLFAEVLQRLEAIESLLQALSSR